MLKGVLKPELREKLGRVHAALAGGVGYKFNNPFVSPNLGRRFWFGFSLWFGG